MEELTLHEIQQGSFMVLLKFKEICEENNLRYFLAYGTLIGAIRHNGFIPWDDDIDVWMPRPDYEKFVQYCIDNEKSLETFALKHYKTCKEYIYPIARLIDTRYKIDYTNAKDYGLGLFIDIYPLDGVNPDDIRQKKKLKYAVRKINMLGNNRYIPSKKIWKNIFKFPYYVLLRCANVNKTIESADCVAQKYSYANSERVGCAVWEPDEKFNIANFSSTVDVVFNNAVFKIPVGYDELLRQLYGDYMQLPPESERIAHHCYTAYKK